jgi:small conductance mechanosensitive channel
MPTLLLESDLGKWFDEHGASLIATLAVTLLAIVLVRVVVPRVVRPSFVSYLERDGINAERRAQTLARVIVTTLQAIIIAVAVLTVLPVFGIDIRPILATVGVAGIALSLGAQSIVRDTLNGIFIVSENQFDRGDVITAAGVTGTVEDVTLRRTLVRDVDGNVYTIPNSAIIVAQNHTREYSRVRVSVPVAVATDIAKVRAVADEVGRALAEDSEYAGRVIDAPRFLRIDNIDMNGVAVQVNGKVTAGSQWEIAGVLRARLLEAFQREGIKTPWG